VTRLLAGQPVADAVRREVAAGVERLLARGGRRPGLAALLVGEDPASEVYVSSKTRGCREVGMDGRTVRLPAAASAAEVASTIAALNADPGIDGILVQLPLPPGLPESELLARVDPDKDVDGFHPVNVGRLWLDQEGFVPATPLGILELLRRNDVQLEGRRAVIVGRSPIVGKPLAALLLREHATVTVCHSRTRDLAAVCREGDILVAAVGRPALVGPEHVRAGAVVVDVGINRVSDPAEVERLFPGDEGRRATLARRGSVLVGDVDFQRVAPRAAAITPVPGGVGPITDVWLVGNALMAAAIAHQVEPRFGLFR